MSDLRRVRVLHSDRWLAAGRGSGDSADWICIGGLFVMALAEHHRARRQMAKREAPLEANPQYFVLGDRIRVSNGRPQGCRLRKG